MHMALARLAELLDGVPVSAVLTLEVWHTVLTEDERQRLRALLPTGRAPVLASPTPPAAAATAARQRGGRPRANAAAAAPPLTAARTAAPSPAHTAAETDPALHLLLGGGRHSVYFGSPLALFDRYLQSWRSLGPAAYEQRQIARARAYYQQVCAYKASFLAAALQAKRRLVPPAVATADDDYVRMRYYIEIRRQRRKEAHDAAVDINNTPFVLDLNPSMPATATSAAMVAVSPASTAAPMDVHT